MIELFSVHDAAADCFIDPFPAPTLEMALRGFREACETEGHQFRKFPSDYCLFHVGTFDPTLGEVSAVQVKKIAMATSFVPGDAVRGVDTDDMYANREVL